MGFSSDSVSQGEETRTADGGGNGLRIGGVVYLNAKPLLWFLPELVGTATITYDVPSHLATRLAAGDLDIALVPVIEAFKNPSYVVVSDACIAADGAARSVILFSRVPLTKVCTVALDAASRTSAAVTRILLAEKYGVHPRFVEFPLGQAVPEVPWDAVLMIGDRAMTVAQPPLPLVYDLGLEWREWTGLPLVFAVWVAQPAERDWGGVARLFAAARDRALAALDTIALKASGELGIPYSDCYNYLAHNLHFTLRSREYESLELFGRFAAKYGFIPPEGAINFQSVENP